MSWNATWFNTMTLFTSSTYSIIVIQDWFQKRRFRQPFSIPRQCGTWCWAQHSSMCRPSLSFRIPSNSYSFTNNFCPSNVVLPTKWVSLSSTYVTFLPCVLCDVQILTFYSLFIYLFLTYARLLEIGWPWIA